MPDVFKHLPLEFKPGVNRDVTEYGAEGTWYSMDKVRFRKGYPQTIGGWQKETPNQFQGVTRNLVSWTKLDGQTITVFGTNNHLYYEDAGVFDDITPVETSSSVTNNLNITNGQTSVVVSINGHNRSVGDFLYVVSQQTSIGGPVLLGPNRDYVITSVIDANTFVVNSSVTATATSAASGGSFNFILPLTSGYQSNQLLYGYGGGGYGSGGYGTAGGGGLFSPLRNWSIGSWGEDGLMLPTGGKLYFWESTGDIRATVVSTAPSQSSLMEVNNQSRQVVLYGTMDHATSVYNPLLVRWSSDEDYTDWVPSGTNTAGDFMLFDGSEVTGILQTKNETLIWTDTALFSKKYIGTPDIFSFDRIGLNCKVVSQGASIDIGGTVYWMGENGFWLYNGQVQPVTCPIQHDLFDEDGEFVIDRTQHNKITCGHNSKFKEIIWLYQSINSTTGECDRYVIYNYLEDVFMYGTLNRTAWLETGTLSNPIAASDDGYLYTHELGLSADNEPLSSYIESAPFDLGDGDEMMFVDRIIPDFRQTGNINIVTKYQKYPNSTDIQTKTHTTTPTTKIINTRGRGRQMTIKVSSGTTDSSWQLGKTRIRLKPDGRV